MRAPVDPRKQRFAFIGFGELAVALAEALQGAQVERVCAFTRVPSDPQSAGLLADRLDAAQVEAAASLEAAVRGADVVIAAVPAVAGAPVVAESAPVIPQGSLYLDPTPRSPKAKRASSELLARAGAAYVDLAVLGTVVTDGFRVPMLAAGPGAERWAELAATLGLRVSTVDGPAGAASLIKLLRSVFMKGRDALILEMILAARRYGVERPLLESIAGTGESVPFPALAKRVLTSLALHADRRADELTASAEALRGAGVDPIVTEASRVRLRWLGELGLREHFQGVRPQDLDEVLAAVDALTANSLPNVGEPPSV